jgi:hypothetical protein
VAPLVLTKVMTASPWKGRGWLGFGGRVVILMLYPQQGQRNDPSSVDMVVSNGAGHKCGNEVLSYLKTNTLVRLTQIWISYLGNFW